MGCIIRLNFPVWPFFFRLCMHWVFGMSKCDLIVTNMSMSTSTTSRQQWDIISTKWIQAAGNRLVKEPFQNNLNIESLIKVFISYDSYLRGRSFYKTKSIRKRFIRCVDLHENSIIKHSILFEKYYRVFANSIIKHAIARKFNYKTISMCRAI